jgi:dipeptidyl aminopeptidase/acylaminoacyl peptidase
LLFSRGETRFSGEVYRLPLGRDGLPAGEPEPVARGMAWADSPVALEAKQVIFHWRSRRGLWRMPFPEFREPIQLGFAGWEAESPAFSSRRQRLVYASGGSDVNIWRIDFTARQSSYRAARVIESTHFDSSPAISPDGSRIAFYSSRSGRNELWASDMDGQNAARLGGPDGRGAGNQQWSPDGRWLAFESRTAGGKADVFAMRADGTAMRQITTDPADDLAVSWSRDGRSIYFSSNRSGAWQIWKSDWETGREERVPTADGLGARESADGYLYYVRARRDSGFGRLWRMKLSTGEEEPMLDMTEICYACFLPFPDELYFLRHDERSGQAALFLQKFASGATHELARLGEGFACCIDMTADRRRFFYTRSEAKGYDLVRVENFR